MTLPKNTASDPGIVPSWGTPTRPTAPPGRAMPIAVFTAWPWPTHSSTECAPKPPVSSRTRSTASSPTLGDDIGGAEVSRRQGDPVTATIASVVVREEEQPEELALRGLENRVLAEVREVKEQLKRLDDRLDTAVKDGASGLRPLSAGAAGYGRRRVRVTARAGGGTTRARGIAARPGALAVVRVAVGPRRRPACA